MCQKAVQNVSKDKTVKSVSKSLSDPGGNSIVLRQFSGWFLLQLIFWAGFGDSVQWGILQYSWATFMSCAIATPVPK